MLTSSVGPLPAEADELDGGAGRGVKAEARGVAVGSGEGGKEEVEGRGLRVGRKDGEEGLGDDGEVKEGFRGVVFTLTEEEEWRNEGGGNCSVTTSKM